MVLRLGTQVLEEALLPEPLHVVPVVDLPVPDRVVHLVRVLVSECLVANVEVKVLQSLDRRRAATRSLVRRSLLVRRNRRRHHKLRLHVAGKAHLGVPVHPAPVVSQ